MNIPILSSNFYLYIVRTLLNRHNTEFPVLVSHTHNNLKTIANGGMVHSPSGHDIRFWSDAAKTISLAHEVEWYDATAGNVNIWVKIPTVSAGVVFYMSYGDPTITSSRESITSVWQDSTLPVGIGFQNVFHLSSMSGRGLSASSPSSQYESTWSGTGDDGSIEVFSLNIAATGGLSGFVGNGIGFGGSILNLAGHTNSGINTLAPTGYPFAFSCWFKLSSTSSQQWIVGHTDAGFSERFFLFHSGSGIISLQRSHNPQFVNFNLSGTVSVNQWYHAVVTFSAVNSCSGYLNGGVSGIGIDTTSVAVTFANLTRTQMGIAANDAIPLSGFVDEVRFHNVLRSPGWWLTEYNNQSSPGTFITFS